MLKNLKKIFLILILALFLKGASALAEVESTPILEIKASPVSLSVGDYVDYTISFQNTTSQNFREAKIVVSLPKEVDFQGSDLGERANDNLIAFNLGTFSAGKLEKMHVWGKVNKKSLDQENFVTTASVVYNPDNLNFEKEKSAYAVNQVRKNNLEARASSAKISFLPSSFLGWLLLLAILAIAVVVIRSIYLDYLLVKSRKAVSANNIDNLPT